MLRVAQGCVALNGQTERCRIATSFKDRYRMANVSLSSWIADVRPMYTLIRILYAMVRLSTKQCMLAMGMPVETTKRSFSSQRNRHHTECFHPLQKRGKPR